MRVSKEFIKYCAVGVVNTLVGLTTAYAFLNLFSCSYLVSTAASYITGIIVSFILNKFFTFKDTSLNHITLFAKFVLSMLPIYVFSYFCGWAVSKVLFSLPFLYKLTTELSLTLSMTQSKLTDNIAVLISMTIYLLLGFVINKFLIFNKKDNCSN